MIVRPGTSDAFIISEMEQYGAFFAELRSDYVVLDIGANVGIATIEMLKRVATVYAIEPHPLNFPLCVANVGAYLRTALANMANSIAVKQQHCVFLNYALVSNELSPISSANMHARLGENQGAHTLVEPRHDRHYASIEVKTLDVDFFLKSGISFDAVKIDIEGGEYDIVGVLAKHASCKLILCEWHNITCVDKLIRRLSFDELAIELGYSITDIARNVNYSTELTLYKR